MLTSAVLLFCCGSMCLLKGCLGGRQADILCFVFVHLLEWSPLKKKKQPTKKTTKNQGSVVHCSSSSSDSLGRIDLGFVL